MVLKCISLLRSSFRSPESVEMDEIMAAMVLTSLSCSPVVQSPPQADPGAGLSTLPLSNVVRTTWTKFDQVVLTAPLKESKN